MNNIFRFSPQVETDSYFWSLVTALCRSNGVKAEDAFLIVAHYHGNREPNLEYDWLFLHGSLSDDARSLFLRWKDKEIPVPEWIDWETIKPQLAQFDRKRWG